MIEEKNIKVPRTARYYISGNLNNKTKNVWFVLHGYGQLAKDFIKWFDELANEETVVIAPEALSKFYLNGGYGNIGATWMTKEDRENEIKDYVNYLDELYAMLISRKQKSTITVNAIGFSQGAATLSRWVILGKSKIDKVIFWAGEIPNDLDYSKLKNIETHLVFGNKDSIFPGDFYKTQEKLLDKFEVKYKTHIFEGGHEVNFSIIKDAGLR